MRVRLTASQESELQSLHRWLLEDPEARRFAGVRLEPAPPTPGTMGTGLDVLTLVLGSGFSAASLGVTIAQWRGALGHVPGRTVTLERPDGSRLTIEGATREDTESVLRFLTPAPEPLPAPAPTPEPGPDDEGDGDGDGGDGDGDGGEGGDGGQPVPRPDGS